MNTHTHTHHCTSVCVRPPIAITPFILTLTLTSNLYRPSPVCMKTPTSVFPTAKVLVIIVNANVDTPKGNIYLVFGSRSFCDYGAKLRVTQSHNRLDNVNSTNTF